MHAGKISQPSQPPAYQWLKTAALVLALALVTTRCLTSEFLRDPAEVMPGGSAAPRGVGAAIGVLLDLACCLPALLILLNHALTRTRRRAGPAAVLFFIFAAFAAISFFWSSDRYATAIGASHLLAAAALLWAMAQIVYDWQSVSAVAATCLGLLLCLLAQGIYYQTVDLPDLRDRWINDVSGTRTNLLRQHNWDANSFAAKQFGLKITHGDLATFFTSANTYAAMLALLAVVVAGIVLSNPRKRTNLALLLLLIPFFWLLWLTQCKAAFVTLALAIGLFLLLRIAGPALVRLRRSAYFLIIAAFLAVTALTVGYGLRHGNLHNDSLNFRWRYWVASARMFREHPLIGVGWNDFGEHYLAVRLPAASEEIKDPHNMLVRAFTESGLVGGGLFVAFLLAAWWRMTASTQPAATKQGIIGARGMIIVVLLACTINGWTTIDFSQIPAYIFIEVMRRFLFMALLMIAIIFVLDPDKKEINALPFRWFPAAVAIALGLFLVHNLVDFALFDPSPGPMMLFALLVGALVGMRSERTGRARFAWANFGIATVVFIVIAAAFVGPLFVADSDAQQADDLVRANNIYKAIPLYAHAAQLIPYNADYPLRQAEALLFINAPHWEIDAAISSAISDDPQSVEAYLLRARYLQRQPAPEAPAIIAAYQDALRLNPNDVGIRLEFADFLKGIDKSQAAFQYQKALWFNDQFPPEEAKRLPAAQVERIRQTIAQLVGRF